MPDPHQRTAGQPGPGLDLTALAALRRPRHDPATLRARITAHLQTHDGYLAFSGGKDSLAVLHLTLAVEPNVPVVFFDSGLEYPETYRYLEQLVDQLHLNFHGVPARTTTLQVLRDSGAWDHHTPRPATRPDLHQVLIAEPAARAHADHGPGELWGVRAQESRGRAALYANALRTELTGCRTCTGPHPHPTARQRHGGVIHRIDGTTAFGPVWDWKTTDVWAYLARHELPVNPVYAKLRALGAPEHAQRVSHMLDGGQLEQGRATWLRRGWPDLFEEIATVLPRLREFV
jgi:phosphoadenosine phosphosulfate reductase